MLYPNSAQSIGKTPLVALTNLSQGKGTILGKIEGRNPAFSIKDRVGYFLIQDAEECGRIHADTTIIEPTSGNTGIALAFVCCQRRYKCMLVMPESMSIERRRVLSMLNAKLHLTPANQGMKGSIAYAEKLVQEHPDTYYMPQQFSNPANPLAHEKTTGPEIWEDTHGKVDVLVAGVGSGGTLTGISRYIKKTQNHPLISVAVEPLSSPVITQYLAGKPLTPNPHGIQGIGAGFIPKNLDLALVDRVECVSDSDALLFARKLATEEGILAGISSGAAAAASYRLSQLPEFQDKIIVTILPDAGERYMSSPLYTELP